MGSKVKRDNPAGRLHDVISKAKASQDASPGLVWSKVFSITPEDGLGHLFEVVRRLIDVQKLVDETEKGFKDFEDDAETYLEPIAPIRQVILTSFQGLNHNVSGLLNPISERHMTLLEVGAGIWSRSRPEPKIDDKQLQEILKQARELFETVTKATDIAEDLRTVILSMLTSIEQAIQQYRIVGPLALESGIVQILGQSRWNRDIFSKTPETSTGGKLLKKVGAIGTALIALMTFANTTRKTIDAFAPDVLFLTAGDPVIPPVDLGTDKAIALKIGTLDHEGPQER